MPERRADLERVRPRDRLLDSRSPTAPSSEKWTQHKFDMKLVAPAQQAQVRRHRRRHRPRRRLRGRDARRARLQRQGLLLPRLARGAPTASPRRAASTRRRTTRTTATASTASSTTRSRAATSARARPTSTGWPQVSVEHHRPVRRAGRALRPRVRRPARQPLLRRRAGVAHLLRPGPDRPAAAARRLPGADAAGRSRARSSCTPATEMLDLVVVDGRAGGIVVPRPASPARSSATRRTPWCSPPAATATSSTCRTNAKALQRHRGLAGAPSAAPCFANPCYTQIHPTCIPASRATTSRSSR